jgi:hypothetical protein
MASKDKPMVTPTAKSVKEKIGGIPNRMAMRFAEEAKAEWAKLNPRQSKKDALKAVMSEARMDAEKAMKAQADKMNAKMMNEASRLRDVGTQLKMEEVKKK